MTRIRLITAVLFCFLLVVLSQRLRFRRGNSSRRANATKQNMKALSGHKSPGAIMMLLSNWKVTRGRTCYFNKSMDALAEHWRPHNQYPIILMGTEHWKYTDMSAIRRTWNTLDFKFININSVFQYNPTIPLYQLEDAKAPLSDLAYKRMCHFFFYGFTQVPELMQYKYLMRMDDDTCIHDNINFDVFAAMEERNAAYGYSSVWLDPPHVTVGMYSFANDYLKLHNTTYTNTALYKKALTYNALPAYNTNLEIINTVRYTLPPITSFLNAVVASNLIFHRRWGDAPLRFLVGLLFWRDVDVMQLNSFDMQHSTWHVDQMQETPLTPAVVLP